MKIVNFVIAGICFLFAIFQWNDPDPLLWIVLYGAVGLIALMAGLGHHWMTLTAIGMATCIYLMGVSHQGVMEYLTNTDEQSLSNAMSKEFPYIEETREYGGALIALIFLSVVAWSSGCCRKKPMVEVKSG